jgi:hypothetical protein
VSAATTNASQRGGPGQHPVGVVGVHANPLALRLGERAGLVEDRGRDPVQAEVVDEPGPADGDDLRSGQPALGGGEGGELRDGTRVAAAARGTQVGEVGDRFERRVELVLGQGGLQGRLGVDQRRPVVLTRRVAQDVIGHCAERVDHGRVEVLASLGPGDLDRAIGATAAVVDLDGVGEVEQPHRQRDRVAADVIGDTLAVPTGEHLVQRPAHVLTELEALRHARRREAVRHQPALHRFATGGHEAGTQPDPPQGRAAGPDVSEHEAQHRQPGEVDVEAVGPERDVITEQRRHLGCVGHTTHPRQRDHVVQRGAGVGLDAELLPQSIGDTPRPQHVVHRLAQPEVGRERERGDEVGQPDATVGGWRRHQSGPADAREELAPDLWGERRTTGCWLLRTVAEDEL